jgi:hypothetical protein
MTRFLSIVLIVSVLSLALLYQNCGSQQYGNAQDGMGAGTINNPITIQAVVKNPQLAGCRYLLCSQDNTQCFVPVGLDPSLVSENMQVQVTGYFPDDVVTACNAGRPLRVTNVTPLSGN